MSIPVTNVRVCPFATITKQDKYDKGKAKRTHFICECGSEELAEIQGIHDNWALWLECPSISCRKTWFVCNKCRNSRAKIVTKQALTRHHREQHIKKERLSSPSLVSKRPKISDMNTTLPFQKQTSCDSDDFSAACMIFSDDSVADADCWERNSNVSLDIWFPCTNQTFSSFKEKRNQAFFCQSMINPHNNNGGLQYLAKLSIIQADLRDEEMYQVQLPEAETNLHMAIAKMAMAMSRREHKLFAEVLDGVWKIGCQDGYVTCHDTINRECNIKFLKESKMPGCDFILNNTTRQCNLSRIYNSSQQWRIAIPQTSNDLRRMFLDGKFSVTKNLPYPPVDTSIPGHAYVSIVDCLRDFLGHWNSGNVAIPHQSEDESVRHCASSTRAMEVMSLLGKSALDQEHNPIILLGFLWSDDFEINTSSKQNRGSAWIKTMSIIAKPGDGQTINHTYPISIGKKGDDHDTINRRIENDLDLLRQGSLGLFYDGRQRRECYFQFDILATLQDQPERRAENKLGAGIGKYTARWGVSCDTMSLIDVLPCCKVCLQHLVSEHQKQIYSFPLPECKVCLRWEALSDSHLAATPLPRGYPDIDKDHPNCRTIEVDGKKCLKPFKITYEGLQSALDLAHNSFCTGAWTEDNCESFLKVEGMSGDVIKEIIERAINVASLDIELSDENSELIQLAKGSNPHMYQKLEYPAMWTRKGTSIETHPDVIMHLLFLGLVQKTILVVHLWLKSLNKKATFVKENEQYLDGFKALSLDWLKVLPYKIMGGWVSENYLAFARVMLWFFQNIDEAAPSAPDVPPPGLVTEKWLKKHLVYWLKVRGLETVGLKEELLQRVQSFMKEDPIPEPIPVPEKSTSDVLHALASLYDLLECVMSMTVDNQQINKMEYLSRIYLSRLHHISETVRLSNIGSTEKPTVVSSYNLQSVMNLAGNMRLFGPLRCMWEGDYVGEAFLRVAKPQISQGMYGNWHTNLMQNILMEKAMQQISCRCDKECDEKAVHILKQQARNYHVYHSPRQVSEIINESNRKRKKPLSCVLVTNTDKTETRMFAVVIDHDTLVEIKLPGLDDVISLFGLDYFEIGANTDADQLHKWVDIASSMNVTTLDFVVLLPILSSEHSGRFSVNSWTWNTLRRNKCLGSLVSN